MKDVSRQYDELKGENPDKVRQLELYNSSMPRP